MNLKKLLPALVLTLGLVACGPTSSPTETPTEEPSETPTEQPSVDPTETPTEDPTETPTETPTEAPFVAPEHISLIGTVGDGADWNTDYDLSSSDEGHTWSISDFLMVEGEEWKVRMNHNWGDVGTDNWGYSYLDEASKALFSGSDNIVVNESGYYTVSFNYDSMVISAEKTGEYVERGWTEDDLALLAEHVHGAEVPYMYIEGNSALYYDDQYDCVSMFGASVTRVELDAYAELFTAAGWEMLYSLDEVGLYQFLTYVETAEGTRIVQADFYALDADYMYAEEGEFWLDIYDHYEYEWDYNLIDEVTYALVGETIVVPGYETADFYSYNTDYIGYGMAWVDCYVLDENASETYKAALEAENFTVEAATDGYSDYVAVDATGKLVVTIANYYEDGIFEITFTSNVPEEPGLYTPEQVIGDICTAIFGSADSYFDLGDGSYGTVVSFKGGSDSDDNLYAATYTVTQYLPDYLTVAADIYSGVWSDDAPGYFAVYVTEDESVTVEIGSFFDTEDSVLCAQIIVY